MQNVNLLSSLPKPTIQILNAQWGGYILGIWLSLLILIYGFIWKSVYSQQTILQQLKSENQKISQNIALMEKTTQALKEGEDSEGLSALLAEKGNVGFSEYFRGLAKATPHGIWLDTFSFAGTHGVSLSGKTLSAETIPQFLNNLSNITVFKGKQFSVLQMQNSDQEKNIMTFRLGTGATSK